VLVAGRPAEGGEHAADLVRRGHEVIAVIGEAGPGDGEPGEGEHGESDVPVPGRVEPDLGVVQGGLVLAGLEAFLDRYVGS